MNSNTLKQLPIAKIRRDSGAQFRPPLTKGGVQGKPWLSEQHVCEIVEGIESGAKLPPIIVFFDGALYWLGDGDHRLEAFERKGLKKIEADIREGTQLDARRFGRSANSEHKALKRSPKTKRAAVVDALTNDPDWEGWSNRAIAKGCDVSEAFVRQVQNELGLTSSNRSEDDNPSAHKRRYAERNGSVYEINTANIGKPSSPEKEPKKEPKRVMLDLSETEISMIYDDPEFQAEYPVSALTERGVVLDGTTEWHGINGAIRESDPIDSTVPLMIWIWPEGLAGYFQVRVFWSGSDNVSESIEPEPIPMLVARLVGLGVPLETLHKFRWKGMPAQDFSAELRTNLGLISVNGRRAMRDIVESCAEAGRSFIEVRDYLKDNTEEGTTFVDWVEGENAMNTHMAYAEKAIAFAERFQRSEDAWERGGEGEGDGALIEAALDVIGCLGHYDEVGKLFIPMLEMADA